MPDSYIFLDVDPKIGAERVSQRAGVPNHFDERKLDFHQRVRAGYMEFFEHVSHTVIDANQSLEKVKRELKLKINSLIRS